MVYERVLVRIGHHPYCPFKENFRAQLTIFISAPTSFVALEALVIPINEPSNTLASQLLLFLLFSGLSFSLHYRPGSHPAPSHFLKQLLLQITNSQVICKLVLWGSTASSLLSYMLKNSRCSFVWTSLGLHSLDS